MWFYLQSLAPAVCGRDSSLHCQVCDKESNFVRLQYISSEVENFIILFFFTEFHPRQRVFSTARTKLHTFFIAR